MATNRPPGPPPPGGAHPPAGKSALHRMGGRRPAVLLGGGAAVLVAVYALYKRSANANASGATTSTTGAPSAYDSTLTDMENQFENQLAAIQAQLDATTSTPATGTYTAAPSSTSHPVILGGAPPTGVAAPVSAAPAAAPSHTQAVVKVQAGNTLSGIAAKFGETWQQVWAYNLAPGVRPAATQATLTQRGPNKLFSGESILIPKKT